MDAGRVLDTAIARSVMGWTIDYSIPIIDIVGPYADRAAWKNEHGNSAKVPCFSTDIAAAWQVVEKMQEGLEWQFMLEAHSGEWLAYVTPHISSPRYNSQQFEAIADTAPHAICLVALEALGVTV